MATPNQTKSKGRILVDWLTTTDHKKIGYLYLITSIVYFFIAGIMALIIRAQLAAPGLEIVGSKEQYNQLFTMHGTIMLLMFATPLFAAFANILMPVQIGAPDVAFPRLNAIAYWFSLLSVFDGSGPVVFARAMIYTYEAKEEDPIRKCFFSVVRDEMNHEEICGRAIKAMTPNGPLGYEPTTPLGKLARNNVEWLYYNGSRYWKGFNTAVDKYSLPILFTSFLFGEVASSTLFHGMYEKTTIPVFGQAHLKANGVGFAIYGAGAFVHLAGHTAMLGDGLAAHLLSYAAAGVDGRAGGSIFTRGRNMR